MGIIGAALFYTYAQGTTVHNFDAAIYFWRGASVLSMVFALLAWNLKARE